MVDPTGEALTGVLDGIFGGTFKVVMWSVLAVAVIGIAGAFVYYYFFYLKRFDITVRVISERGDDKHKMYFDKGGIFRDKKKNTDYLKLYKLGVELEVPKFNIMHSTNKGDYIELFRESERGFRFLTPPRVSKNYYIGNDGKKWPMRDLKQYQIENSLSWVLERQKTNKKLINPEGLLLKLLEHAPQIISMAFSFIILWIVFKYAPQMLSEMKAMLNEIRKTTTPTVVGSLIPLVGVKWLR